MKTSVKLNNYISMYYETRCNFNYQAYNFSETLATDEYVRNNFIRALGHDDGLDLYGDSAFEDMYAEMTC